MMDSRKKCSNRHENGNCLTLGGFCTAVPDEYCKMSQELEAYRAAATLEKVREWAEAEREICSREKTSYIFCEEVAVTFPDCDGVLEFDDPECEPSSACVIKCASCGWHMYGDGWWGGGNFEKSEQIPRFCAHCGREFDEEAESALNAKEPSP